MLGIACRANLHWPWQHRPNPNHSLPAQSVLHWLLGLASIAGTDLSSPIAVAGARHGLRGEMPHTQHCPLASTLCWIQRRPPWLAYSSARLDCTLRDTVYWSPRCQGSTEQCFVSRTEVTTQAYHSSLAVCSLHRGNALQGLSARRRPPFARLRSGGPALHWWRKLSFQLIHPVCAPLPHWKELLPGLLLLSFLRALQGRVWTQGCLERRGRGQKVCKAEEPGHHHSCQNKVDSGVLEPEMVPKAPNEL